MLPKHPSEKLVKVGRDLMSRPHVCPRISLGNVNALHLPFPETTKYCRRNKDECTIIPMGLKKGWPSQIDFTTLESQVRAQTNHLWAVLHKETKSLFLEHALQMWAKLGATKAQSAIYDMGTYQIEQPGYYGPRGFEIMYNTLHQIYLHKYHGRAISLAHPLSPEYTLRKVLIPEEALGLISNDLFIPIDHPLAMDTLEQSRTYGNAMFPDED